MAPYLPNRPSSPGCSQPCCASPESALLDDLKEQPERMRQLDEPAYDPEQVLRPEAEGTQTASHGRHELPNGNAFPSLIVRKTSHCVRWMLNGGDAVAAALPSTCEPEAMAEKAKACAHARSGQCRFPVRLGFLARRGMPHQEIQALDRTESMVFKTAGRCGHVRT